MKDPIAIIGMGCRFPGGAVNPLTFWQNLLNQVDAVVEVPKDRWDYRKFYHTDPKKPGKSYVKRGAFLQEDITTFDPLFFGISPREAECMDPQQRYLLQATWEAIEDAGLSLSQLQQIQTGVFVGGFCLDNLVLQFDQTNRELADAYSPTSGSMNLLANRLSYIFDLQGPSITVDTACSSSLVAVHLACQSLRQKESECAIVGGINIMMLENYFGVMSKGHFLSPDGHCKAFDEAANGYARGEGVGIVILKPYQQAISDGDFIYALIRETGTNQDGRTAGIALPNATAQEALMRDVYQRADIHPNDISYVEAHGTGTQAGDITEIMALQKVLSEDRDPTIDKVFVGSAKTNIGHLEAAAGIAGLIKTALSLQHKKIAPNLHFNQPNPKIDFDHSCLVVPTEIQQWKTADNKPRLAVINSFGFGGSNAHALLQEAPELSIQRERMPLTGPFFIPLSTRHDKALKQLARDYRELLHNQPDLLLQDLIYSTCLKRNHLSHRVGIIAETKAELGVKLEKFSQGVPTEGVYENIAAESKRPNLVFVYTGMGPQWHAMGRELLQQDKYFSEAIAKCDVIFRKLAGWSIINELKKSEENSRIQDASVAQPANFMLQYALTETLKAKGIVPDAVVGHSIGEVAAACIAGALSLEEALLISYHRSRLQETQSGLGAMLAVGLSETEARQWLLNYTEIDIAAVNSPNTVTLAGDKIRLQNLADVLTQQNIFNRFLYVNIAYHSYQMNVLQDEFQRVLSAVRPNNTIIPFYSTVTGTVQIGEQLDVNYWWSNVRQPVQFATACLQLIQDEYLSFLEVGPHPVLSASIRECFVHVGAKGTVTQTLNRKTPEILTLLGTIAKLYTHGFAPNWLALVDTQARYIKLPHYPWQKEIYWRESQVSREDRLGCEGHVFFNTNLRLPHPAWQVEFSDQFFPYLNDHQVQGNIVFPGAAYIEMGLLVHEKLFGERACQLEDLQFHHMLIAQSDKVQFVQTHFDPKFKNYSIFSCNNKDQAEWQLNATGHVLSNTLGKFQKLNRETLHSQCPDQINISALYQTLEKNGLYYGPCFRTIQACYRGEQQLLVHLQSNTVFDTAQDLLYPPILDGAFQALIAMIPVDARALATYVPVSVKTVKFYQSPVKHCWCYSRITAHDKKSIEATMVLFNIAGEVCVELETVCFQALTSLSDKRQDATHGWFYELTWKEAQLISHASFDFTTKNGLVISLNHILGAAFLKLLTQNSITTYQHVTVDHLSESIAWDSYDHFIFMYLQTENTDIARVTVDKMLENIMPIVSAVKANAATRKIQIDIIVSRGDMTTASLWGLGALIEHEYSQITCRLIEIGQAVSLQQIYQELTHVSNEKHIALRGNMRWVQRLMGAENLLQSDKRKVELLDVDKHAVELAITELGSPNNLFYQEVFRKEPRESEVEIKLIASPINFKDLLKLYGQLPEEIIKNTFIGDAIGMEMVGTIVRLGPDVKNFQVGDTVIAIKPGTFCSYAVVSTAYIAKIPKNISSDLISGIGYVTAYYGLINIANLREGEKVLIHNATGSVGQAAIQLAQWKKCEIYVTAGTAEKRAYLQNLGIKFIYDSRSLQFYNQIFQDTQGQGVDVVLNAMSGEALYKSFELLAPYGRFIEIGKKDIAENNGLPMRPFNHNLLFASIDLDRILVERPALAQELLSRVMICFEQGIFTPVPTQKFKASEIADAFHFIAQNKHIGKVIITYENDAVLAAPLQPLEPTIKPNHTYLITGGTSGVGFAIAQWLVDQGATHLVLVSRHGTVSEENQAVLTAIKNKDITVCIKSVDVASQTKMAQLMQDIQQTMPPLRGIIHSAMVLDDGFLIDLDENRFRQVMRPKIAGAIHLHELTKNEKLDFFVMFSSISSLIGNPGQGNYIIANGFLDALAQYRREQGLPATTINWGVFSETGIVSRHDAVARALTHAGITGFSTQQATAILKAVIEKNSVQIGVFDVDWQQCAQANPAMQTTGLFQELICAESSTDNQRVKLLAVLLSLSIAERQQWMENKIREILSKMLKLAPEQIASHQSIISLGLESLMGVELMLALKNEFGINMTVVDLLTGPTIAELATTLLNKVISETNTSEAALTEAVTV